MKNTLRTTRDRLLRTSIRPEHSRTLVNKDRLPARLHQFPASTPSNPFSLPTDEMFVKFLPDGPAQRNREAVVARDFSIHGQVRSYERTPIFMIKVSVYRDTRLVDHVFTDEEGK